jgi:L-rhamnose isomerase
VGFRQLGNPIQGLRAARRTGAIPSREIADAAQVQKHTGLAPTVALHIPWDAVDSYSALRRHAQDHGVALGTINSNTFQDDDYKLGSIAHADARSDRKALDHHYACIEIMTQTGSRDLKIWLADGTNYPGQDDLRAARIDSRSLRRIYERIGPSSAWCFEYKFFEPAFYHTDVPDWGTRMRMSPRSASARGMSRHRPSRAGHEYRIHRHAAACASADWARSISTRDSMRTTI